MATSPFSLPTVGSDNPLSSEYLALERQKKIADLLMQKGQEQPQGQMVSGHYVAPSWAQQINPLVNSYVGSNLASQNEAKTADLAKLLRGQNVTEAEDILSSLKTNPQQALTKAIGSQGSFGQSIAPQLVANMFKEDVPLIVPQGALAVNRKGETIVHNPKENVVTGNLAEAADFLGVGKDPSKWTPAQRADINSYMNMDANRKATKITVGMGGPQEGNAGFNKRGDWVAPNGATIPHTEVTKDREVARTANELQQALSQISSKDVKASESILGDVTQGGTRGYIARQTGSEALKAQTKINASAVMQVLNNLPPGPASDKDIAQARSSFPGYGNASALQSWIDNTNQSLERKINNVNQKYGSQNWYGANSINTQSSDGFTIRPKGQ